MKRPHARVSFIYASYDQNLPMSIPFTKIEITATHLATARFLGFIGASVCLMCLSSSRPQEISGKVSWTSNELTRMKPMGVSFGLIIPAVMKV